MYSIDTPRPAAGIRGYHAHVYYEPPTRVEAEWLREQLGRHFTVQLGRWHDKLVGPHSGSMYQVAFAIDQFAELVPWLMLNRRDLRILVHPDTGAPRDDHLVHALWLGEPLALKGEVLPLRDE